MPDSDPLQILLRHDRWATTQILSTCAPLPFDQFHRRFDIGPGSLHDTLTHIIAAARAMADWLAGHDARPRIDADGRHYTPQQLTPLLDELYPILSAEAHRRPLDEVLTRTTRDGRTLRMSRAAILVHVPTHGMHHRAQCLNMLRRLAVTPLPPLGVAEWTMLPDT